MWRASRAGVERSTPGAHARASSARGRRARAGVTRASRARATGGGGRGRPVLDARDRAPAGGASRVRQSRRRARATGGARTKTSAPRSSLTLCESSGAIPQVAEALLESGEPSAGTSVKAAQVRTAVPPPPPKRHATARPRPPAAL